MDKMTLYHIKAAFDQDGADAAYKEICRVLADSSHESSGLNKPVVNKSDLLKNNCVKVWKLEHKGNFIIGYLPQIAHMLKNIDTEEIIFSLEQIEITEQELNTLPVSNGF